jgi:ElaB/YqjD/DUF883 family membrane-anchored ribosome-binding protein
MKATNTKTEDGASEVQRLFDDVQDLLEKVTHLTDTDTARVRHKVESSLRGARDSVIQGATQVRDQARQVATQTNEYAHQSPWMVAGAAGLLGVVVGVLFANRR